MLVLRWDFIEHCSSVSLMTFLTSLVTRMSLGKNWMRFLLRESIWWLTFSIVICCNHLLSELINVTQWSTVLARGKAMISLFVCSIVQEDPLPQGWEMRFTAEGVRYFVDHNTRSTTFQDPRGGPAKGLVFCMLDITLYCICLSYTVNNNHDDIYSAVIMTEVIARVHLVHLVNVEQRQAAADSQTKPPDLSCKSAYFRQRSFGTTISICRWRTMNI